MPLVQEFLTAIQKSAKEFIERHIIAEVGQDVDIDTHNPRPDATELVTKEEVLCLLEERIAIQAARGPFV